MVESETDVKQLRQPKADNPDLLLKSPFRGRSVSLESKEVAWLFFACREARSCCSTRWFLVDAVSILVFAKGMMTTIWVVELSRSNPRHPAPGSRGKNHTQKDTIMGHDPTNGKHRQGCIYRMWIRVMSERWRETQLRYWSVPRGP